MNAERRKKCESIVSQLEALSSEIEDIQNEEQESLDNMPENLASSLRAETFQFNIDSLEDANSEVAQAVESLKQISSH